ncbi:MAG: BREX-2 system adenine-specific DNA-methyltransferase PglX [Sandaracinaceae bacterium]|nr:BREX-2 system adenine-specific DNA-methyltransferase PglX [Sandaracinaceae bacterium]
MARAKKAKKRTLADLPPEPDARAPIDAALLVASLQPVRKDLEKDLLARAKASPAITRALKARHKDERESDRTADDFASWQRRFVEQVAAAWILSCVFVRTLEDRGLLAQRRIAGPGAMDAQRTFLQLAPSLSEREYLLTTFREMTRLPAAAGLFDGHDPVWMLAPSAEGARALLAFFRTGGDEAPALRFGQPDTRFLGDLYQDLNENVRKRYALLQTPDFIEQFILDRTLEPAIEKFGLDDADLCDPTCGSGHFLLGAFDRFFAHVRAAKPALTERQAALEALDKVYGADINPYAVAIAKFRLTLSFLDKGGFERLADAPQLPLHVAVADSLLYNPQHGQRALFHQDGVEAAAWERRAFDFEDEKEARAVLHREYAAVVGNPPYITVKDAKLRDRYRALYASASGKYSLSVPFCERFFQLARRGGRTGQITANSFMKREFGKKLIEEYLRTVDLDLIVNTSGAYIPGHGTPTVLLFGAHQPPASEEVLAVLAKRGEPTTPAEPARGLVWSSVAGHWDDVGFEDDYISVARVDRAGLGAHPWSLAGGGAVELKTLLEERAEATLGDRVVSIGFMAITGEDDVYVAPRQHFERHSLPARPFGFGEAVRDWSCDESTHVLFPYDKGWVAAADPAVLRFLWPYRTRLTQRLMFGKTQLEAGHAWFEYRHVGREKLRPPTSITFPFVATHNHFVLDRGGKVFNRTAPIIKLPETATEDDHLALLAYLNSSIACFWMKQVCFPKGGSGIGRGIQDEEWESRFEFDGTKVGAVPLPEGWKGLATLGRTLSELDITTDFDRMVMLQETLDWTVYRLFGLIDDEPLLTLDDTKLAAGSRAFEHRLVETTPTTAWFKRNRYRRPAAASRSPISEARLRAIASSKLLDLLERPENKRRWTVPPTRDELDGLRARRDLLDGVEAGLAESREPISNRLRGTGPVHGTQVDGTELSDLIAADAVPYLAAHRYTDAGLDKRAAWERTWDLQRREDAGEKVGAVPVPPKYAQKDFRSATYWRLRGKLDVPKERFISYPGCESDEDGEPVYGWAGWDHAQRAQALVALYQDRKTREGWTKDRLTPMLVGVLELLPWLKQWHDEPSPDFDQTVFEAYDAFLDQELREHGLTRDDLRAWRPAEKKGRRR